MLEEEQGCDDSVTERTLSNRKVEKQDADQIRPTETALGSD